MKIKYLRSGAVLAFYALLFIAAGGQHDERLIYSTQNVAPSILLSEKNYAESPLLIYEEVDDTVYAIKTTNVYINKDTYEVLLEIQENTELHRVAIGKYGWDKILIEDQEYYISNEDVTTTFPQESGKDLDLQIAESRINPNDLRLLSAIIYAEAENQCEAGQQAVGIIVMNRVNSDKFPNSIEEVLYQKGQFTPISNGRFLKALSAYDNDTMSISCIEAAKYAILGNKVIEYNDMLYDLSDYLFFSRYVSGSRLMIQEHQFK
jgi:spore germination cell wall hydrolase CwlJ-like protein